MTVCLITLLFWAPLKVHQKGRQQMNNKNDEAIEIQRSLIEVERRLNQLGVSAIATERSLQSAFQIHLASGGERIRAKLTLEQGYHLGLPTAVTEPLATAIEVLHQASLIHDDILDGDKFRRGQKSVWFAEGTASAVCLGDALISQAFDQLTQIPDLSHSQLVLLVQTFNQGVCHMAAGQSLDCAWRPDTPIPYSTYEHAVRLKSGPLLGFPIALPLALSKWNGGDIQHILDVAMNIGIAYQLADDFADREEDKGSRLNGYWVLIDETGSEHDAEHAMLEHFNRYIETATTSLSDLPLSCQNSLLLLINRLKKNNPLIHQAA